MVRLFIAKRDLRFVNVLNCKDMHSEVYSLATPTLKVAKEKKRKSSLIHFVRGRNAVVSGIKTLFTRFCDVREDICLNGCATFLLRQFSSKWLARYNIGCVQQEAAAAVKKTFSQLVRQRKRTNGKLPVAQTQPPIFSPARHAFLISFFLCLSLPLCLWHCNLGMLIYAARR
jgi:hypothetical protein